MIIFNRNLFARSKSISSQAQMFRIVGNSGWEFFAGTRITVPKINIRDLTRDVLGSQNPKPIIEARVVYWIDNDRHVTHAFMHPEIFRAPTEIFMLSEMQGHIPYRFLSKGTKVWLPLAEYKKHIGIVHPLIHPLMDKDLDEIRKDIEQNDQLYL